jgi:K+/H+ antiporter YhaU regulatory subunit KhtT
LEPAWIKQTYQISDWRKRAADWDLYELIGRALDGGFKIVDSNGQTLAYVYDHADPRDAGIAKALTLDEARRIAANIAKLPSLLRRAENAAD